MLAHILRDSGFGCNAFLGGIAANYNTNFWSNSNNVSIAEADEYDRSFLRLNPDIAIITSMDADHLDIYGTHANMEEAFISFSEKIKKGGTFIYKHGLKRGTELKADKKLSYSVEDVLADAHAENVVIREGSYKFDVVVNDKAIKDVVLEMGGRHNIENAIACIAAVQELNISDEAVKKAVSSFKGVKRRFEYVLKTREHIIIDDYAHHPQELNALIESVKELYPDRKCTIVFQPHLYSRTRDLAEGFGQVLSKADEVFLLPIYPAREEPMEGVTSELIIKQMGNVKKEVVQKEDLLLQLRNNKPALLLIAGAGDIDMMVDQIKNIM
jgi:UDP-N-acetylmuramate--alanine ligase